MSQKIHPQSLRVNHQTSGSNSSYSESLKGNLFGFSLRSSVNLATLLQNSVLFKAQKAPSNRRRKKSHLFGPQIRMAFSKGKVCLTSVCTTLPRVGMMHKFSPIQKVKPNFKSQK